jgi:hypothetical protein
MKTFLKMLARQLRLKLTKFTRRSRGARGFYNKFRAGCGFLKDMSQYNWEVIHRSRRCLKQLAGDNVHEVFVYGERDVTEVLYGLTFEIPVKIKTIWKRYEPHGDLVGDPVPEEISATTREKVLVASLVNIEESVRRLRELGVDDARIVLLR